MLEGLGERGKEKWKDEDGDGRIRGLRALRNLNHCLRVLIFGIQYFVTV
jgi:hypothetical protein